MKETAQPHTDKLAQIKDQITALIARAESTNHEAERDLCLTRVEALMIKHSITRAMINSNASNGQQETPTSRDILVPAPYATRNRHLLSSIAGVFNCPTLRITGERSSEKRLKIYGMPGDLDLVEKLYASLIQQRNASLYRQEQSSTSFRISFLHAYNIEVRRRMKDAYATEVAAAAEEFGQSAHSTEVILHDRARAVEELMNKEYTDIRAPRKIVTTRNEHGRNAGLVAGNEADITLDGRKVAARYRALE